MLYLMLKKYLMNTRKILCFQVILQPKEPIECMDPHFL